jgi:hypothetical protein
MIKNIDLVWVECSSQTIGRRLVTAESEGK